MTDLRRAREGHERLPRIVIVHQGTTFEGEKLLSGLWADAPAVSDPERRLYSAFGLQRGSLGEVLGLSALAAGFRALAKGHFIGKPVGDPMVMPGLFLVHGTEVLWRHEFAHVGDLPARSDVVAAVDAALPAG